MSYYDNTLAIEFLDKFFNNRISQYQLRTVSKLWKIQNDSIITVSVVIHTGALCSLLSSSSCACSQIIPGAINRVGDYNKNMNLVKIREWNTYSDCDFLLRDNWRWGFGICHSNLYKPASHRPILMTLSIYRTKRMTIVPKGKT